LGGEDDVDVDVDVIVLLLVFRRVFVLIAAFAFMFMLIRADVGDSSDGSVKSLVWVFRADNKNGDSNAIIQ
jgi:hypothetical protein